MEFNLGSIFIVLTLERLSLFKYPLMASSNFQSYFSSHWVDTFVEAPVTVANCCLYDDLVAADNLAFHDVSKAALYLENISLLNIPC